MARSSDNFTKIPNEVLEALVKIRLGSYEIRLLLFIICKTCGWHKTDDWISLSQLVEGARIRKTHVCRTIKSLEAKNIIVRGKNKHVGLQRDYTIWMNEVPNKVTSLPNGVTSLPDQVPTKETVYKRNLIQNKRRSSALVRVCTRPLLAEEKDRIPL